MARRTHDPSGGRCLRNTLGGRYRHAAVTAAARVRRAGRGSLRREQRGRRRPVTGCRLARGRTGQGRHGGGGRRRVRRGKARGQCTEHRLGGAVRIGFDIGVRPRLRRNDAPGGAAGQWRDGDRSIREMRREAQFPRPCRRRSGHSRTSRRPGSCGNRYRHGGTAYPDGAGRPPLSALCTSPPAAAGRRRMNGRAWFSAPTSRAAAGAPARRSACSRKSPADRAFAGKHDPQAALEAGMVAAEQEGTDLDDLVAIRRGAEHAGEGCAPQHGAGPRRPGGRQRRDAQDEAVDRMTDRTCAAACAHRRCSARRGPAGGASATRRSAAGRAAAARRVTAVQM